MIGNHSISVGANGSSGVNFVNSYGQIFRNTISLDASNPNAGVICNGSSPVFGTTPFYAPDGNNIITGGAYGESALSGSSPWVGGGSSSVGYNSICDNRKRVHADASYVSANENWWGTADPHPSWFEPTNGGVIRWDKHLTDPPPGKSLSGECTVEQSISQNGNVTLGMTDTSNVIYRALKARNNGNRVLAKNLLRAALLANPNSEEGLASAEILMHLHRESPDSDISDLLMQVWQQRRSTHARFANAVAKVLQRQERCSEAMIILNGIAAANRGTVYEKRALLDMFYLYFTQRENAVQMAAIIGQLQRGFPNDAEVREAEWFNQLVQNVPLLRPGENQSAEGKPTGFRLDQNYPNPFNPTTTIRFTIPQAEYVTLKVYDMLGREIGALIDEVQGPGFKSVDFEASKLSSGVYIYELTAGTFSSSRKLAVVK